MQDNCKACGASLMIAPKTWAHDCPKCGERSSAGRALDLMLATGRPVVTEPDGRVHLVGAN